MDCCFHVDRLFGDGFTFTSAKGGRLTRVFFWGTKMRRKTFALWFASLGLGLTASNAAWSYQDAYYESFAGIELAAISIANPYSAIGIHYGNATNIAVGGGKVYFQDGVNIFSTNPDLTSVSLFHSNGLAPTDIAVDAKEGVLYESFAGIELAAISIANPYSAVGIYYGNATNIAVGDGTVYFQDGKNIYSANPDRNYPPPFLALGSGHGF
jgi:hypothetical protein